MPVECAYHSFVAYRLDEAIEDLGECMSADLGSTHTIRIPVHAVLPVVARDMKSWKPDICSALVDHELLCAFGYFSQYQSSFLLRGFIDICSYRNPERIDSEHGQGGDKSVDG